MERNEIKENLVNALKGISKDTDFLLAVINHVRKDKNRIIMTDFILSNPNITYEEILLSSLEIYESENANQ